MVRAPCCEKLGLKKGPWTPEEDHKLITYIHSHGLGNWRALPKQAGLSRCGKSCRLRWTNYLRPGIKRGNFSSEEEHIVIQLHATFGNRWSAIATHLPGRTDNEIKNYWNTRLKKSLLKMGIDPVTHLPAAPSTLPMMADCSYPNPLLKSALLHNNCTSPNQYYTASTAARVPAALVAQWDVARLEARLAMNYLLKSTGLINENNYASSDCNINQLLTHLLTMKMLGVYHGAANSVENIKHEYAEQQLGVVHDQHGFNSANMYSLPCSKLNPLTINTDSMLNLNEVAYDHYNSNMPSSSEQQLLPFLEDMLKPSLSQAAMSANFNHTELPTNASLANQQEMPWVQGQRGNESANHLLPDGASQLAGSFSSDINHHALPMTLPPTLLWDELVMTQQADNDVASSTPSTASTITTSSADNNKDYWAALLKLVTSNYHLHQR